MGKTSRAVSPEDQGRGEIPPPDLSEGRVPGRPDHLLEVLERLERVYRLGASPPEDVRHEEPLDGLILTLLSQNTNDRNRDAAYEALRQALPDWSRVAEADLARVEALIRPAGLAPTKALRMKALLERIEGDFGVVSLRALRERPTEEVREYLSAFPGIGPKTVACVLLFDLGRPAFPVDTHVARLAARLGWALPREPRERLQVRLEAWVPPEKHLGGHLDLIAHGRAVCGARKPRCGSCVLADLCPSRREGEGGSKP
jgi:endonuclease-3